MYHTVLGRVLFLEAFQEEHLVPVRRGGLMWPSGKVGLRLMGCKWSGWNGEEREAGKDSVKRHTKVCDMNIISFVGIGE